MGKAIELLTTHEVYRKLGRSAKARQTAYTALFEGHMEKKTIDEISDATLKGWVLGNDRFKQQIEKQTHRRIVPQGRGGDRKSKAYREQQKGN